MNKTEKLTSGNLNVTLYLSPSDQKLFWHPLVKKVTKNWQGAKPPNKSEIIRQAILFYIDNN